MTATSGGTPQVALATVVGLGLLLMPLTTMWHEIGGHALACAAQGGRVASIGAFYVDCAGLDGWPRRLVALAGAGMDAILAVMLFACWRRARGDLARLALWYGWVGKAFTAAGYLCFSGVAGIGDLAPGAGLGPVAHPLLVRVGEAALGIAIYTWLVMAANRSLTTMLGGGAAAQPARRRVAHGYYATAGVAAVAVGLANPIGFWIVLISAAASTFGGLAGLISVGFTAASGSPRAFAIRRNLPLVATGVATTAAFAAILGPTFRP